MKKLISVLVSGVLFTSLFTSYAIAQQANNISFSKLKTENNFSPQPLVQKPSETTDRVTKAKLKLMKANKKAAKAELKATTNFNKTFSNTDDLQWYVEDKIIMASFKSDKSERHSCVVYDKKGNWVYTILNYSEDKLPASIRADIHKQYKCYSISLVQEISQGDIHVIKVLLNDGSTIKNILVYENELIPYDD